MIRTLSSDDEIKDLKNCLAFRGCPVTGSYVLSEFAKTMSKVPYPY